jgi:hypothetical protein
MPTPSDAALDTCRGVDLGKHFLRQVAAGCAHPDTLATEVRALGSSPQAQQAFLRVIQKRLEQQLARGT